MRLSARGCGQSQARRTTRRLAQLAEELARAFEERDKKLTKRSEHKAAKNEAA